MPHQCTDCGRRFDDGSKEMLSGCPNCGGNKFQFLPDGAADGTADASVSTPREPPEQDRSGSTVARTVGNAATAVRDFVGSSEGPPRSEPPTAGPESTSEPGSKTDRTTAQSSDGTTQTTNRPTTQPSAQQPGERSAGEPSVERPSDESPSGRPAGESRERTPTPTDQSGSVGRPTTEQEQTAAKMAETENAAQASARSEVISPDELPSTSNDVRSRAAEEWSQSIEEEQPQTEQPTETDRPDLSELREELNQQFESIKVCEPGQYELNLMELFDREEYIIALQEDGKYTVQVPEHWQE